MRVQAAVSPAGGQVAALGVAVSVLGVVGADHAGPAFLVRLGQQHPVIGQPDHHVICAIVRNANRAVGVLGLAGRHVQGGANLLKGEITLGVELAQLGSKVVAARLHVDRARNAEVTHRIASAGVGVASIGNRSDGRAELGLGGLLTEHVTPLERTGAGFDLPRRLKRRHFRGFVKVTHVVQHHHQHILASGGAGARMAVLEAVNDKAGGVAVDGPLGLDLGRRQHGGPSGLDGPIGVILHLTFSELGLLPYQQKSFTLWGKSVKILYEIFHGFLL